MRQGRRTSRAIFLAAGEETLTKDFALPVKSGEKELLARACRSALLDAMGRTIDKISRIQNYLPEEARVENGKRKLTRIIKNGKN